MKPVAVSFKVFRLDAYHYRIEARNKSPLNRKMFVPAVFNSSLGELHIQKDVNRKMLGAILNFSEKNLGKVKTIVSY